MKRMLLNVKNGMLAVVAIMVSTVFGFSQVTYNSTATIQTYTVPNGVTVIGIDASGAQGGANGGLGAQMYGEFAVTPGEVLTVIVGEEGFLQIGGNAQNSAGGGGGSFVYNSTNTLLIAAGGGGGLCPYTGSVPLHPGAHGQVGPDGGDNSDGTQFGGTGGNGGQEGIWSGTPCAGGGTGWLTPGGTATLGGKGLAGGWIGGDPYCAGGGGGCGGYGGFGGGGGAGNLYGGGGGGGGYSGGAGGNDPDHGGGGGSFNGGTNQSNAGGVQSGNGVIVITEVVNCTPTVLTADVATLSDVTGECSVDPASPTATNDCGQTIDGTPDVTFPITALGTTVVTWTYDDGTNTITQTQNIIVTGPDVNTTLTGTTLTADAIGATYQWLDCDNNYAIVNGETNQFFIPTSTGNYAVEVTSNGCTDTSACTYVGLIGLSDLSESTISLYPNPVASNGQFTISYSGSIEQVDIIDMLGRKVFSTSNVSNGVVNPSALDAGRYIVQIKANNNTVKKQLIVLK